MSLHKPESGTGYEWSYRDLLTALFIAFMAFAVLALLVKKSPVDKVFPVGTVLISMQWDPASDSDIDLWVQSPADSPPVGYAHPASVNCNLLRDDLGKSGDAESTNSELTVCRRPLAGEWTVDGMAYNIYDRIAPVGVDFRAVEVEAAGSVLLATGHLELTQDGDAHTAFHFWLDSAGHLVPGSVSPSPDVDLFHSEQTQ